MIGSFLTRGLVMIFGYAYPAYECYKTVEKNKPEIEQLRFWCQYWILVAVLTVCERIGDAFISWVPMYSEAKLAFFIYLWYPKTKGTSYVYDSFFRPYVAKHETEIDRNLLELRTTAGDMLVLYWQRAASYGQTRIFEILQFVAAQSTPTRQPAQQGARARKPAAAPNRKTSSSPSRKPATDPKRQSSASQPEVDEPPSPTSSIASSQHQTEEVVEEVVPSPRLVKAASSAAALGAERASAAADGISKSTSAEAEATQIVTVPASTNQKRDPPPKDTVMEEAIRVTRGRLRKTRSASTR